MPVDPRIQRAKVAIRRARLYTWCNRLVRWLPNLFCVFVALFVLAMWIAAKQSEYYGTILAIPTAAAVLLSGIAYPCSLTLRDRLDRGIKLWRLVCSSYFGLRPAFQSHWDCLPIFSTTLRMFAFRGVVGDKLSFPPEYHFSMRCAIILISCNSSPTTSAKSTKSAVATACAGSNYLAQRPATRLIPAQRRGIPRRVRTTRRWRTRRRLLRIERLVGLAPRPSGRCGDDRAIRNRYFLEAIEPTRALLYAA